LFEETGKQYDSYYMFLRSTRTYGVFLANPRSDTKQDDNLYLLCKPIECQNRTIVAKISVRKPP